jgi:hypothetical protein
MKPLHEWHLGMVTVAAVAGAMAALGLWGLLQLAARGG